MRRLLTSLALCLVLGLAVTGAKAVAPDEMLANPALEKRARAISAELRCMVCQNESIDDSNADLAKDLRLLVRERLVAGDTDEQVRDFLVSRYGEFVLLRPRLQTSTLLLWGFPIGTLIIGGTAIILAIRRRRAAPVETAPLSENEKKQLRKLFAAKRE
jgi:cytochrome c-type biogenesis protein CcmH